MSNFSRSDFARHWVLCLAASSLACGASGKGAGQAQGDDAGLLETVVSDASLPMPDPTAAPGQGVVETKTTWLWPPSGLRRSPGRNHCGSARDPDLVVELMGGLRDTAVVSETGPSPESASMSLSDCRIRPKLVVVGVDRPLRVQNLDVDAREVIVESLNEQGVVEGEIGRLPMRVAGQRFELRHAKPGLLRLRTTDDPDDLAYVLVTTGTAGVTGDSGIVSLELPAGTHQLQVWHPPISGQPAGLESSVSVEVLDGARTKQVISLATTQGGK